MLGTGLAAAGGVNDAVELPEESNEIGCGSLGGAGLLLLTIISALAGFCVLIPLEPIMSRSAWSGSS